MSTREVTIRRISPRSAFRTALALSLAGLVAWIICVILLYLGLQITGVWGKLNSVVGGSGGDDSIPFSIVISLASLGGAINAILITVLAPLIAVMYNNFVDLFGGLVVTLRRETD